MATPNPLDPKYAPGAEQSRQDVMVGVTVGMTLLGVTCVVLRVYTRGYIVKKLVIADWTMVAATTLTIVLALLLIIGAVKFKLGFSGMRLSPGDMVSNIQLILAVIVVYKTTVTLIKVSILMIYLKLKKQRSLKRIRGMQHGDAESARS